MIQDERSSRPVSSSMMRVQAATRLLAEVYRSSVSLVTSAVNLRVELAAGAARTKGPPYAFNFTLSSDSYSGIKGAALVGAGKIDVGWLNPSVIATMAYLGKGPYRRSYPLRALAIFPSWDRMVFAVSRELGVESIAEIKAKRLPLRVSVTASDCTVFAVKAVLRAHGLSLEDFVRWGGAIDYVPRPSNPRRPEGFRKGAINAVVDEGVKTWGQEAVDNGMVFLPYEEAALRKLERYGFQRAKLSNTVFERMRQDEVTVVDFSGWPLVTHSAFPEDLAYALVAAVDALREDLPYDSWRLATEIPLMESLCHETEAGPLGIPLHPGAERYFRDKGYL